MKMSTFISSLIMLLIIGCSQTQTWVKKDGNQQAFDLDSRECENIAQKISLQQSQTGKKADPVFYNQAYLECLGAKGWRLKTTSPVPEKEKLPELPQDLAQLTDSYTVRGFGQTITVPNIYRLTVDKQFQIGPAIIKQFFWKGEDSSFINILFQENTAAPFEHIPYPVLEPYILYTAGQGEKAEEKLHWATFFGNIDNNWIMGTGAYYYADKKQRVIIAITKPLQQPTGEVPQNVTLSRDQFLEIEKFSYQWQVWLNEEFQQGPGILKKFIDMLHWRI